MYVKVSRQGNVIEITRMLRKNDEAHVVKLNADEYLRLSDGEICQFNHTENRSESKQQLYKTFRRIRAIINTNFQGGKNERFITLTYAENMRDTKRLYMDFKKFWKKFKYRWGKAEYFVVAEPQVRGAWHLHVLVKFVSEKAPYIPNAELRECWGNGFVNVRSLKNVDNIGAYLSAYLGDVEVEMSSCIGQVKEMKDGTKKRFVKGARLCLYPPGMNIYRCSRGMKMPDEYWSTENDVQILTRDLKPTYANSCSFINESGFKQEIQKEYYNVKRKNTTENRGYEG